MATVFFTGFEAGNIEEIDASSGTCSVQSTTKRTGTYALKVSPTGSSTGFGIIGTSAATGLTTGANIATAYVRFYFYYVTKPASGSEEIFRARAGSLLKATVKIDSTGKIIFADSAGTSQTGATILSANTWYRIETKITTSASTTDWEVKIDGVSELLGSNFGAMNLLASNHTRWNFGKSVDSIAHNTVEFYYDDILISDSAYPGAGACLVAVPSSSGTYQTGTATGAATHWQCVNQIPEDGDTTYVLSDGVATDAEANTVQDHTTVGISGTVNSVRGYILCKRDGASSGSLKHRFRSNTTNSDSTAATIAASYIWQSIMFDTDPATAAAWTLGGLDTIQIGFVENSANKSRMTASYVFVDFAASTFQAAWAMGSNKIIGGGVV